MRTAHTQHKSSAGQKLCFWMWQTELSFFIVFEWNICNSSCTSTRYMVVGEYTNYLLLRYIVVDEYTNYLLLRYKA